MFLGSTARLAGESREGYIRLREDFGADGVQWTGLCLRELTQWIQALYALQLRQPTLITWAELATGSRHDSRLP
jgi:hypothetical protein